MILFVLGRHLTSCTRSCLSLLEEESRSIIVTSFPVAPFSNSKAFRAVSCQRFAPSLSEFVSFSAAVTSVSSWRIKSYWNRFTSLVFQGCFFKKGHTGLFFVYFRFFKQTLQFLQQISVQRCPSSNGAGIQTYNPCNIESPPITTRLPSIRGMLYHVQFHGKYNFLTTSSVFTKKYPCSPWLCLSCSVPKYAWLSHTWERPVQTRT